MSDRPKYKIGDVVVYSRKPSNPYKENELAQGAISMAKLEDHEWRYYFIDGGACSESYIQYPL